MKIKRGGKWEVVSVTNYQLKASFIRKIPVKFEWPIIRGARAGKWTKRVNISKGMKRAVVYADGQVGFLRNIETGDLLPTHDESAFGIVAKVIQKIGPDLAIDLGDSLDMAEWSTKYLKRPEFYFTTQPALDWQQTFLKQIRPHCAELHMIAGNHEDRMPRAIIENLLAAADLKRANMPEERPVLSPEFLLGLEELEIQYHGPYPSGELWLNDDLVCRHGDLVGAKPGQTAQKYAEEARSSMMVGHVHRQEIAHKTVHTRYGQKTYGIYVVGCLCKIDGTVPANSTRPNWHQGFAVVDYNDRVFHIDPVNIYNGQAVWNRHVFEVAA